MQKHQPCSQATFSLSHDVIFFMVSPLLERFLVSFNLQSAICGLQSAVCGLQSAVCSLRSAVCSLRSAVCSLQSANVIHRMYPGQTDFFLNQYEEAVTRPFGYLLIDLTTTTQYNCRLRTTVLSREEGFNQAGFK